MGARIVTFPWEESTELTELEVLQTTVRTIQADMEFACRHTAVLVRSSNVALRMVVNTMRGQEIPNGVCTYTEDTIVEFQDIGMPQPGIPTMTMQELVQSVHAKALELGLELLP